MSAFPRHSTGRQSSLHGASRTGLPRSLYRALQLLLMPVLAVALLLAGLSTAGAQIPQAQQMQQAQQREAGHYAALDVVQPVQRCEDLTQVDITLLAGPGSRITAARETQGKSGTVCTVSGLLAPAIQFSLQLPLQHWTQRYLQIGCGGLCGNISAHLGAADGCVPFNAGGFVTGATDMGHQDQDGSFGEDPQKRADFAYRAQHLTALVAKKVMRSFYGRLPVYSYFSGCSDGGREALIEAQRYPEDFNGIIAGAAAMNFMAQNAVFHAWQARANTGADGKAILLAGRLPILHKAVLEACDKIDGIADGLISNPLACHFDPATIQCPADAKDTSACLTAAEVGVVRKFYDGPRDSATGKRLIAGTPQFGSELAWAGVYVPRAANQPMMSEMVSLQVLRHMAFDSNPPATFSLADMHFDLATFDQLRGRHRLFDATNPDLSAFAAAGGKLILWHGWADPHISPINTIAYYTAVQQQMGPRAQSFTRLYLFPGMYHCSGGEGPYQVDLLTPMMNWVEGRQAPDVVVASQPERAAFSDFGAPMQRGTGGARPMGADGGKPRDFGPPPGADAGAGPMMANGQSGQSGQNGQGGPVGGAGQPPGMGAGPMDDSKPGAVAPQRIVRTRPIYPWPYSTVYDGKGDPGKASSFVRGPVIHFDMPDWAGADFYKPYVSLQE